MEEGLSVLLSLSQLSVFFDVLSKYPFFWLREFLPYQTRIFVSRDSPYSQGLCALYKRRKDLETSLFLLFSFVVFYKPFCFRKEYLPLHSSLFWMIFWLFFSLLVSLYLVLPPKERLLEHQTHQSVLLVLSQELSCR